MAKAKPYTDAEVHELREVFSLDSESKLVRSDGYRPSVSSATTYCYAFYKLPSGRTQHAVHRLVWILSHGCDPCPLEIDHIDHDPHNNHPSNLRAVTKAENMKNRRHNSLASRRAMRFGSIYRQS